MLALSDCNKEYLHPEGPLCSSRRSYSAVATSGRAPACKGRSLLAAASCTALVELWFGSVKKQTYTVEVYPFKCLFFFYDRDLSRQLFIYLYIDTLRLLLQRTRWRWREPWLGQQRAVFFFLENFKCRNEYCDDLIRAYCLTQILVNILQTAFIDIIYLSSKGIVTVDRDLYLILS